MSSNHNEMSNDNVSTFENQIKDLESEIDSKEQKVAYVTSKIEHREQQIDVSVKTITLVENEIERVRIFVSSNITNNTFMCQSSSNPLDIVQSLFLNLEKQLAYERETLRKAKTMFLYDKENICNMKEDVQNMKV
jgi:hypothetical protein